MKTRKLLGYFFLILGVASIVVIIKMQYFNNMLGISLKLVYIIPTVCLIAIIL
ncbi:MAG: hypothetical protein ACJAXB_001163 [Candidatus Endobugula sp.]|jgi:hypothetical protein